MQIKIQQPVTVRVNNTATIFMAHNVTTSSRTKHVDCRLRYVNEYVEDGVTKIIFVKSKDNDSDLLTKNLGSDLYTKHSKKLITEK